MSGWRSGLTRPTQDRFPSGAQVRTLHETSLELDIKQFLFRHHSVVVSTWVFESHIPSSNLGGTLFFIYIIDVMSERLRRWTANPLGFARAGSNPADIAF